MGHLSAELLSTSVQNQNIFTYSYTHTHASGTADHSSPQRQPIKHNKSHSSRGATPLPQVTLIKMV